MDYTKAGHISAFVTSLCCVLYSVFWATQMCSLTSFHWGYWDDSSNLHHLTNVNPGITYRKWVGNWIHHYQRFLQNKAINVSSSDHKLVSCITNNGLIWEVWPRSFNICLLDSLCYDVLCLYMYINVRGEGRRFWCAL